MAFTVQRVSIFYDIKQDRLNLLFIDKGEQVRMGAMTRRLLKILLACLPGWLEKNIELTQRKVKQSEQQRRVISQFHHEAATGCVKVTHDNIEVDPSINAFVIETINLANQYRGESEGNVDLICLSFLDATKEHDLAFFVTTVQLHKFIGEILAKVDDWALVNPWGIGNEVVATKAKATINVVH